MKNFILGFLVAVLLAAGGAWLFLRNSSQPVPAQVAQAQKYHCPMHPSYVSDKPGDCRDVSDMTGALDASIVPMLLTVNRQIGVKLYASREGQGPPALAGRFTLWSAA